MFNLSFLNSILLFGLIAGIIPILIHLFVKHQPKIVYFSSLRFLKQIQKNQARFVKLREILLLVTRILIIVCLILALSRPVLKTILPKAGPSHAPTVAVMIIDNSFSMNYLVGEQTLLDKAKEIAMEITKMLSDKDRVMLLTLNNNYNSQSSYFAISSEVKERIKKISITDNSQLIKSILIKAEKKLSHQDVINKEIYLITDNQKYIWKNISEESVRQKATKQLQTDTFVIPVLPENDKMNLSTISAWFVPKLLTSKNQPEIRASIKNFSNKKVETVIVSLILNNITQAEKVISLNPFQSKQVSFELNEEDERFYFGKVKVKDEMLPDDNNFYFNFPSQSPPAKVPMESGRRAGIGKLPKIVVISESNIPFQFATVLDLITENNWQRITPKEISDDVVTNNHLFILYRLGDFSEKLRFFADEILKSKKSIFIIPGEKLAENNSLKIWLNNKDIKFDKLSAESSHISFINRLHPICAILTEEMFQKTRIDRMWNISAPDFSTLLADDEGKPILLISEGAAFDGNNKFLISAIDFEESWTNLIFQTVFPVLCYHIGNFLGTKECTLNNYTTGMPFSIPITSRGALECHLPNGEVVPLLAGNEKEEFTHTDQQGQYFLFKEDALQKVFSYNTPREESDLTTVSEENIQDLQSSIPKLHFLKSDDWKGHILTSRYGYEFWKTLLWIVLGLLIVEMILAYSGKKGYKGNKEIRR